MRQITDDSKLVFLLKASKTQPPNNLHNIMILSEGMSLYSEAKVYYLKKCLGYPKNIFSTRDTYYTSLTLDYTNI